ncbi:MAG: single-stranded-DNA-specific exonuclease RecJ [Anaerolineae bacterium]
MPTKVWNITPEAPPEVLAAFDGLPPAVAQVLINRGKTDPELAMNWLRADDWRCGGFTSYTRKAPIEAAAERLRQAIADQELIIVYGDFDADGVSSTALMVQALRALGGQVKAYIPSRVDEGYGVNNDSLHMLKEYGARVIVTVDCGIRSVEEVALGESLGLAMIVTDHHSVGEIHPAAHALINPKLDDVDYSEPMLAGVGVAFRLAELLLDGSNAPIGPEDLLDLVAIGTVADLAPLSSTENRALVRAGLNVLKMARRPGVRALLQVSGIPPEDVNASSIGFGLGPRINAAGRLAHARQAYQLLITDDDGEAAKLAAELQALNVERQRLTREAQDMIRAQLSGDGLLDAPLIFAGRREFKEGIVGLVAGRLTEEFYRPSAVLHEGDAESRASCRSIPGFHITHALDQCQDLLVRHGGHAQAAGFTVRNEHIPELRARLTAIAGEELAGRDLRPALHIDMVLQPQELTLILAEELKMLEPTGQDNPSPLFAALNMRVMDVQTVGKDGQHLRFTLRDDRTELVFNAIGFRMGGNGSYRPMLGERVDAAFQLEPNTWRGETRLQLRLEDLRPTNGG